MRPLKQLGAEITALSLIIVGILFLADKGRLVEGMINLMSRSFRNVSVALSIFYTFFKPILSNPWNTFGLTLILVAVLVLVRIQVRKSFIKSSTYRGRRCPICSNRIQRADQKVLDHLVGLFAPLKRYECSNYKCEWNGRRVTMRKG